MSVSPPIIFIHKGPCHYLPGNISHVRARFGPRRILTLSDRPYADSEWVPLKTLGSPFTAHYQHLSTVDQKFELFCFNRWFMLAQALHQHNLTQFIHLDSDCMLFDDAFPCDKLGVVGDPTSPYYAFTKSGHSLFSNRVSLEKFCQFMETTYTHPETLTRLKHLRATQMGPCGGVTDMTLFGLFSAQYPDEVRHQEDLRDGICSDDNFNAPGGFQMDGPIKKIVVESGHPYGFLEKTGEKIRFRTLHFQGSAKPLMSRFSWGDPPALPVRGPLHFLRKLWRFGH